MKKNTNILSQKNPDPPGKPHLEAALKVTGDLATMPGHRLLPIIEGAVRVRSGEEILLVCKINTSIKPFNKPTKIIFRRNGKFVTFVKRNLTSMTIHATANENGAFYQCEAQNEAGTHISSKLSLDIQCKLS